MTDKPNTLALNARQWRVLMNDHLEVLKAGILSSEVLDDAGLKNVFRHLDEVRLMAGAWYQNSPVPEKPKITIPDLGAAMGMEPLDMSQPAQSANGVAPKKGGWPKGKSRKQPAQAVL